MKQLSNIEQIASIMPRFREICLKGADRASLYKIRRVKNGFLFSVSFSVGWHFELEKSPKIHVLDSEKLIKVDSTKDFIS